MSIHIGINIGKWLGLNSRENDPDGAGGVAMAAGRGLFTTALNIFNRSAATGLSMMAPAATMLIEAAYNYGRENPEEVKGVVGKVTDSVVDAGGWALGKAMAAGGWTIGKIANIGGPIMERIVNGLIYTIFEEKLGINNVHEHLRNAVDFIMDFDFMKQADEWLMKVTNGMVNMGGAIGGVIGWEIGKIIPVPFLGVIGSLVGLTVGNQITKLGSDHQAGQEQIASTQFNTSAETQEPESAADNAPAPDVDLDEDGNNAEVSTKTISMRGDFNSSGQDNKNFKFEVLPKRPTYAEPSAEAA